MVSFSIDFCLLCKENVNFYKHPYLCLYQLPDHKGKQIVSHDLYRRQDYPSMFVLSHFVSIYHTNEIGRLNNNFYNDETMFYDVGSVVDVDNAEDLNNIESRIKELIALNYDVEVEIVSKSVARKTFIDRNETYKVQIVDEIPDNETIKLYKHQEYIDMCRGPHVPNTKHLNSFKLTQKTKFRIRIFIQKVDQGGNMFRA